MASEKRIMPCGGTFRSCDGECWKCGESKAKTDAKTESDGTIYGYNAEQSIIDTELFKEEK